MNGSPDRTTMPGLVLPVLVAAALALSGLSGWLDRLSYDLLLANDRREPAADIIIVAIDEQSLAELGRWPWPRQRQAALLQRLTAAGARGVLLNVVYAEPDINRPTGDAALATAIGRHGKVVLPVLFESVRQGGQWVETLPFPPLGQRAGALGHVDIPLDPDGQARGIYRRAGLGKPFWMHASLALLDLLEPAGVLPPDPALDSIISPYQLIRQDRLLIPYAGPPGRFPRASASDVIAGRVPDHWFRGRIVFVGMTATGLGEVVLTPVSGPGKLMSGVEFNANVFDALRQQRGLRAMSPGGHGLLSALLALAATLACWYRRKALSGMMAILTLALSFGLAKLGLWFPPAAALVGILLAWGLWWFRRVSRLSDIDSLTGLYNRRRFDQALEREWRYSRRHHTPLSLLLIDVDYFKRYNDRHGHLAGDSCLRQIGPAMATIARRPRDMAARYGGEEFVVLLGETAAGDALNLGETLRRRIEDFALPHQDSEVADRVTVSIGIATGIATAGEAADNLVQRADAALYQAKHAGRNRVWQAPVPSAPLTVRTTVG